MKTTKTIRRLPGLRPLTLACLGILVSLGALNLPARADNDGAQAKAPANLPKIRAPHDSALPPGPQGDQIRYGRRLLTETKRLLPDHVGDALNCTSCHLAGGKTPKGSPFVGVAHRYPAYNPRAGRVVTLEERINGCFLRSMNGSKVPPESKEMQAMVAYMNWLSKDTPANGKVQGGGVGKINKDLLPDPVNGKRVYDAQCAVCHGQNGEGVKNARGEYVFPPLWGKDSFNVGAGMARTYTAAAFVKNNMPIGHGLNAPLGQGGVLNDQEAVDVAEYFSHQPRPDFPAKVNDWPKGGKPKDARY